MVRQERPPSPDRPPTVPVFEKDAIEEEKELPMEIPEAFRFMMGGKLLPRPNVRHMAFAKWLLYDLSGFFLCVFLIVSIV